MIRFPLFYNSSLYFRKSAPFSPLQISFFRFLIKKDLNFYISLKLGESSHYVYDFLISLNQRQEHDRSVDFLGVIGCNNASVKVNKKQPKSGKQKKCSNSEAQICHGKQLWKIILTCKR